MKVWQVTISERNEIGEAELTVKICATKEIANREADPYRNSKYLIVDIEEKEVITS